LSYHNEIGNDRREGLKKDEIGQSAAKRLWRKPGEGSTTRIDHLKARPKMMKSIGTIRLSILSIRSARPLLAC